MGEGGIAVGPDVWIEQPAPRVKADAIRIEFRSDIGGRPPGVTAGTYLALEKSPKTGTWWLRWDNELYAISLEPTKPYRPQDFA